MDKKSLSYHTKVQDWSQLYRLTADGKIYKDTKEITYLTPQKIQEIDSWRNNVRKKLNKNKSTSGQSNLTAKRVSSANQSRKGMPQIRDGAKSAGSRHIFLGTDVYSVSNHLAETSLHYAAMREDIYKANKTESIRKPTKPVLNGTAAEVPKKIDKVIQFQNSVDRTKSSSQSSKVEGDHLSDCDSETISLASTGRMTDRGKVIQVKDRTMISSRSVSNNLLNVISIDDCKMALQRRPFVFSSNSEVNRIGGIRSELSENKTMSSVANSVDIQKHENRPTTVTSGKTTSYYPSMVQSRLSNRTPKMDRKMRVNKAIDTMINDRKVMNNMDRNFDVRIAPAGRLVLERNEGGYMFKRLHCALRKHVDNILSVQAHRRSQKHVNGMDDQFSSYIQQIASSMQRSNANGIDKDTYRSDSSDTNNTESRNVYRSESKRQILQDQSTIFEEDEDLLNDNNTYENGHENSHCYKNGQDDNKNLVNGDDKKTGVENNKNALTIENVSTQNGVSEEKKTSEGSGYQFSSATSSISIQNVSEQSMT